jgi:hypothetical protein
VSATTVKESCYKYYPHRPTASLSSFQKIVYDAHISLSHCIFNRPCTYHWYTKLFQNSNFFHNQILKKLNALAKLFTRLYMKRIPYELFIQVKYKHTRCLLLIFSAPGGTCKRFVCNGNKWGKEAWKALVYHMLTILKNNKASFKSALRIYFNTHSIFCWKISNVQKCLISRLSVAYNDF